MPWRFVLQVRDVSDVGIEEAALQLSTWTGAGNVLVNPRQTIGATHSVTTADNVINVVFDLTHPRFGPLAVNLVRSPGESVWRWTDPRQRIWTKGSDVVVEATMFRARAAPVVYVPEEELVRRATAAKSAADVGKKKPLETVRVDNLSGVLITKDNFYRNAGGPEIPSLHLMAADPLGDANAAGWKRFKSTVHAKVWPWRDSRIQMVEYGEIGTNGPYGPRFLAGVFLPKGLTSVGRKTIDFMVWFSPNPRAPAYPHVEYPFRGDYPYVLMALGAKAPYEANQRYVTLPYAHLNSGQHFLAYNMVAAKRAAAIVIPVAPSAHFELWESPVTLMRMLKEICRWLPRDDNGRQPKVHPPPPSVGRVGVSGFSAAGVHLSALLARQLPSPRYREALWGTTKDAADFDAAWGELWSIDNNLGSAFRDFVNRGAAWSRQGDRRFRVYKNEFTGYWDPRKETRGEFARAMKNVTPDWQGTKEHWAISMAEPSGRIHAISVSTRYVVSPGEKDQPTMPNMTHENMPRLFFGHAAATSGYTKLS
jgi:hypothetical protein